MSLDVSQHCQKEASSMTHSRFSLCFDDPVLEASYTEVRHKDLAWYALRTELLAIFCLLLHFGLIQGHNDGVSTRWPWKECPPSLAIPILWLFFGFVSTALLELARRRGSHYLLEKSLVAWSVFILTVGPGFSRYRIARVLGEDPYEAWQQTHFEEAPVMMAVSCAVCALQVFVPLRCCASIWIGLAATLGFGSWATIMGGSEGGIFWDVEHAFLIALMCFLLTLGSRRYELCERQLFLNLTQEQRRGERLATVLGKQMALEFSKEPPRGALTGTLGGLRSPSPARFPSGTVLLRRSQRTNGLELIALDKLLSGDEVLALDLHPPDRGSPKPCLAEVFKVKSVAHSKHRLKDSESMIQVEWQREGSTCTSTLVAHRRAQFLLKTSDCERTAVSLGSCDLPLGGLMLGMAQMQAGNSVRKPTDWAVVDLELVQKELISAKCSKDRDNVGCSRRSVSFEFLDPDRFLALLAFSPEDDHSQGIVDSLVACYTYVPSSAETDDLRWPGDDSRASKSSGSSSISVDSDVCSDVRVPLESVPEESRHTV